MSISFRERACTLGPKANLAMVAGADRFLDYLDHENHNRVNTGISLNKNMPFSHKLIKMNDGCKLGRNYMTYDQSGKRIMYIWLCPVMLYTFGHYPRNIYFYVEHAA